MKIRCTKIFDEHTQQYRDTSLWLTIGKEYLVLSVTIYAHKVWYNIVNDDSQQSPGSHDAIQFEVISHHIPSNWGIKPGDINLFTLEPRAWSTDDFWDRCFDGDPAALELYWRETNVMMEEESKFGKYTLE